MRNTAANICALAGENLRRAVWIDKNLPALLVPVPDWTAGGVSTSDGPKVSGGDIRDTSDRLPTDPDGNLVQRHDQVTELVLTIQRGLKTIASAQATEAQFARQVEAAMRRLQVMDPDEARRLSDETGARTWQCANHACGAVFVYSADQRPRAGRCRPCYLAWKETGTDRPHLDVHKQPEGGCEDCKRVHTGTAA